LETSISNGLGGFLFSDHTVLDGLDRSVVRHNSGTFGTNSSQRPLPSDKASDLTKHLGTRECHQFRKEIFERHPQLSLSMASSYLEIAKSKGYIEANHNLFNLNQRLNINDLNLSANIEALKSFAR